MCLLYLSTYTCICLPIYTYVHPICIWYRLRYPSFNSVAGDAVTSGLQAPMLEDCSRRSCFSKSKPQQLPGVLSHFGGPRKNDTAEWHFFSHPLMDQSHVGSPTAKSAGEEAYKVDLDLATKPKQSIQLRS